jgi:hypothetical protein
VEVRAGGAQIICSTARIQSEAMALRNATEVRVQPVAPLWANRLATFFGAEDHVYEYAGVGVCHFDRP